MQDPLKQGLKHLLFVFFPVTEFYSNARSTKTRIETAIKHSVCKFLALIRMQDPLKQGLKHKLCCACTTSGPIRMQDPLKQGLKQK